MKSILSVIFYIFICIIFVSTLLGSDFNKKEKRLLIGVDVISLFTKAKKQVIILSILSMLFFLYASSIFDEYHLSYVKILIWIIVNFVLIKDLGLFKLRSSIVGAFYLVSIGVNYYYSTFIFGSNLTPASNIEWFFDIFHFIITYTIMVVFVLVVAWENNQSKNNEDKERTTSEEVL